MSDVSFSEIPLSEWEQYPLPQPKGKPDKYGELVAQVEQGKIIVLTTESDNDLRGKRIAIGRRARLRGFLAEFRVNGNKLAVKKSENPIPPKREKPVKSRSKKTESN